MQNAEMSSHPIQFSDSDIRNLFDNDEPLDVWLKASEIVQRISPQFDFSQSRCVFDDVLRLFDGSYPGYLRIQTPYHDLRHTLDIFICSVRMLHGVHLSLTELNDEEINLVLISAMLHDIGYAQKPEEPQGSGAQFTKTHVARGIAFMESKSDEWQLPNSWPPCLAAIIQCTNLGHNLSKIEFPSQRIRLLGQIVASADLVGQMADRTYLEKLLFLFLEFKEAEFGDYKNTNDLLKKTRSFYNLIRTTLENALGGICHHLQYHFKDWYGVERNFYVESVERNILYLDRVISLNEEEWLNMLKRHGIVKAYSEISKQNN
ncbi:MAG: HD domain-containing protein [Gallionellaceae bacterium]|nr:HD domain-containing protein [Gallionellaceae bacterium]